MSHKTIFQLWFEAIQDTTIIILCVAAVVSIGKSERGVGGEEEGGERRQRREKGRGGREGRAKSN